MRFINRKTLAIAGAAVALVAVGSTGTAVAGSLIGSSDIQDGSIRSIDVKDGSLKRADLSHPINRALDRITKDGVQGPKGETGAQGIAGPQGAPGVDGKNATLDTYIVKAEFHVASGASQKSEGTAACHPGDLVLSGGYSSNDQNNHWTRVYQNRMTWVNTGNESTPDAWYVQALGSDDGNDNNADILVWAYCTAV